MHTVIATWYVKPGNYDQARKSLCTLAARVKAEEPDTWGYLVHSGATGSLPPGSENDIVFIEMYKDKQAFLAHVNGCPFQDFLKQHKDLFVTVSPNGASFFQVQNIDRLDGFVRQQAT